MYEFNFHQVRSPRTISWCWFIHHHYINNIPHNNNTNLYQVTTRKKHAMVPSTPTPCSHQGTPARLITENIYSAIQSNLKLSLSLSLSLFSSFKFKSEFEFSHAHTCTHTRTHRHTHTHIHTQPTQHNSQYPLLQLSPLRTLGEQQQKPWPHLQWGWWPWPLTPGTGVEGWQVEPSLDTSEHACSTCPSKTKPTKMDNCISIQITTGTREFSPQTHITSSPHGTVPSVFKKKSFLLHLDFSQTDYMSQKCALVCSDALNFWKYSPLQ